MYVVDLMKYMNIGFLMERRLKASNLDSELQKFKFQLGCFQRKHHGIIIALSSSASASSCKNFDIF